MMKNIKVDNHQFMSRLIYANNALFLQKWDAPWLQAVNYWNMATIHINKVPHNTFKWKEIQPLISTYNLSFAKARNKSNEIR